VTSPLYVSTNHRTIRTTIAIRMIHGVIRQS
jgi:hypothetical protein